MFGLSVIVIDQWELEVWWLGRAKGSCFLGDSNETVFDLFVSSQVLLLGYTLVAPGKVTLVASLFVYTLSVVAKRFRILVGSLTFVALMLAMGRLTTIVMFQSVDECNRKWHLLYLSELLPVARVRTGEAVGDMIGGEAEAGDAS